MNEPVPAPSFAVLLQRFFTEHLQQHRAVSPRTIVAYRDTFRLLLAFAEKTLGREPQLFQLPDLNAKFILAFLDYLETERKNSVRSRNARLAAVRSFLKYAAHHDLSELDCIQHALAVPMKRFDRPLPEFLSRKEIESILDAPDIRTWCGQRDRALFTTLYNTGARVSEALRITVRDLILDGTPAVHIHGKGRKQRSVPLWRSTASLLRSWTDTALQRISSVHGAHVAPEQLQSTMGRYVTRAIRSAMLSDIAVKHCELLTNNILHGDPTTYNPPEFPEHEVAGVGLHEAPRGTLSHWVVIEKGVFSNYQAVVPTTWNASPRDEKGLAGPYESSLLGNPVADPANLLEVLRTVHSFDPCMACACHTFDPAGREIAQVKVL